jgi:hypothetical protein
MYTQEEVKDIIKTYEDVAYEQGRIIGQKEAGYILAIALKKLGGPLNIFDFELISLDNEVLCSINPAGYRTYYLKKYDK